MRNYINIFIFQNSSVGRKGTQEKIPIHCEWEPIHSNGYPFKFEWEPIHLNGYPFKFEWEPIHLNGFPFERVPIRMGTRSKHPFEWVPVVPIPRSNGNPFKWMGSHSNGFEWEFSPGTYFLTQQQGACKVWIWIATDNSVWLCCLNQLSYTSAMPETRS